MWCDTEAFTPVQGGTVGSKYLLLVNMIFLVP